MYFLSRVNLVFVFLHYLLTFLFLLIAPKIKHVSKKYKFEIVFSNRQKNGICFNKCKDKDNLKLRSNVIYEISCKNCTKVYIGQTKKYMKKRIYEHKNNCEPKQYTALTKHQFDNCHRFNFDNIRILDNERSYKERITKEMLFINKNTNSVNERSDVENLSIIFRNL